MAFSKANAAEILSEAIVSRGEVVADARLVRKYQTFVNMATTIQGKRETAHKVITFEIGCRDCDRTEEDKEKYGLLRYRAKEYIKHALDANGVLNIYESGQEHLEGLEHYGFKQTFTPTWKTFNFDGMVKRLSSWLAYCTWNEKACYSDMVESGATPSLNGVVDCDQVRALSCTCVFIPQQIVRDGSAAPFWALVWAATATGSEIVTDYLTTAKNAQSPLICNYDGPIAWYGATEALSRLGHLYQQAGYGRSFALAFTAGIHSTLSVVGHSDEGSFLRDVLRRVSYGTSFGGIPPLSPRASEMLCLGRERSVSSLITWIDTYALSTAAAVAHADPLSIMGPDKAYPSVYTSDYYGKNVSMQQHVESVKTKIMSNISPFVDLYTRCLGLILGYKDDLGNYEDGKPSKDRDMCLHTLRRAFERTLENNDNRHLSYQVVAPFFWIEPTGILPRDAFSTPAEEHGWASLGCGAETTTLPYFTHSEEVSTSNDAISHWRVELQGARKSGLLLYLNGHPLDGLSTIVPLQMGTSAISLTGIPANASLSEYLLRGASMDKYLWVRGQSKLIHPAEFINIDDAMGLEIHHMRLETLQGEGATPFPRKALSIMTHIPSRRDILDGKVDCTFSQTLQIPPTRMCMESPKVNRMRNAASKALDLAATLRSVFTESRTVVFPVSETAPRLEHKLSKTTISIVSTNACIPSAASPALMTPLPESAHTETLGAPLLQRQTHEAVRGPPTAKADISESRSFVTAQVSQAKSTTIRDPTKLSGEKAVLYCAGGEKKLVPIEDVGRRSRASKAESDHIARMASVARREGSSGLGSPSNHDQNAQATYHSTNTDIDRSTPGVEPSGGSEPSA